MPRLLLFFISILLASTWPSPVAAAPTPAQRCEADVDLASAKFAQCRLTAEARFSKSLDADNRTAALQRCSEKLQQSFAKAVARYGLNCPSEPLADFDAYLARCSDDVAAAAAGGVLPDYVGALATCSTSLSSTQATLTATQANLTVCQGDLANCQAHACGSGTIEGTEECDGSDLASETCVTRGFAGGTLRCASGCKLDTAGCYATRWVDNGDGTATDNKTGLQWELKSASLWDGVPSPDPHDPDNHSYSWCVGDNLSGQCDNGYNPPDGTVFTEFLATLNGGVTGVGNCASADGIHTTEGGFAGHCDWRLPTIEELLAVPDGQYPSCIPCTSIPGPFFPSVHWTSTHAGTWAWLVNLQVGGAVQDRIVDHHAAIAVRGGS